MWSPCTHYCCRELDHINLNQNNISHIKDGAFWGLSKVINSCKLLMLMEVYILPYKHTDVECYMFYFEDVLVV